MTSLRLPREKAEKSEALRSTSTSVTLTSDSEAISDGGAAWEGERQHPEQRTELARLELDGAVLARLALEQQRLQQRAAAQPQLGVRVARHVQQHAAARRRRKLLDQVAHLHGGGGQNKARLDASLGGLWLGEATGLSVRSEELGGGGQPWRRQDGPFRTGRRTRE